MQLLCMLSSETNHHHLIYRSLIESAHSSGHAHMVLPIANIRQVISSLLLCFTLGGCTVLIISRRILAVLDFDDIAGTAWQQRLQVPLASKCWYFCLSSRIILRSCPHHLFNFPILRGLYGGIAFQLGEVTLLHR